MDAEKEAGGERSLAASPASLRDLVAYQPGAVVSRVLLKKQAGNVTLFAFAAGEGLSEHTAPFDALVYAVEGEVEVTIAGVRSLLRAGDAVIMPAGLPHAVKAVSDFKMLLVMIKA